MYLFMVLHHSPAVVLVIHAARLDKVGDEALQGLFPTEDRSQLGSGEVERGMRGGCRGVSTDDGGYGEVGEVEVRDEEVWHAKLKCEAHHGQQVRGMACTKRGEAIAG